jgi:hypothetical protein
MQKTGWIRNRMFGAALACVLAAGVLGAITGPVAVAAAPVSPSSIDITSGGVCSTSGSATYPISINLPTPYVNSNVDVALLLDDTGSFSSEWSSVASTFSSVADQLQTDAPGVTFGFGVSMFKDYGGAWTGVDEDDQQSRPFILNQPVITASTAGSASALDTDIANAVGLADQLPGSGGDTPEASLEGLYQLATGTGLDGNGNGSDLDSGPAGALATEETPGDSGDVPPFSSNVAATSGSLGGIGWRPGALHIAIVATDTSPVAAFPAGSPIPATITSANGSSEPSINFAYSSLTPGDNRTGYVANTTDPATNTVAGAVAPAGAATVQGTVNALNALGIRVLGMGPGDAPTSAEGPGGNSSSTWLSSMARLTGATAASGNPLVFDTNGDPANLAKAIVSNIQASAAKPVNVGFTTSGLPSGLSVSFSPNVVDSVAPGSTASTTATIKATGSSRNGTFNINFVDASSGAELGSVPVTVDCAAGPIHYVALGDSYSSGEGNPPFLPGTNTSGRNADQCHRSYVAYPEFIDQDPALDITSYTSRACSGATSAELEWGNPGNNEDAQVGHITSQTNLVTIGVGGDDVGFSQVLAWCITGLDTGASSDCPKMRVPGLDGGSESLANRETQLISNLGDDVFCYTPTGYYDCGPSLHSIYEDIASRAASGVRIIVLLYPHLFTNDPASTGCHLAGADGSVARISEANILWLNQGVDQLDAKIISEVQIAKKAGLSISYADPRPDWSATSGNASPGGHGVCTKQPWINGLIIQPTVSWIPAKPSVYSFHPNATGQKEFYQAIVAKL